MELGRDGVTSAYEDIVRWCAENVPFAAVVVFAAQGSTPQDIGVRAVIDVDSTIHGTVGGGLVEAAAQRAAVEACRSGAPALVDVALDGESADELGPICGGLMTLLIDPTARRHVRAYAEAARAVRERRTGVLMTRVHGAPDLTTAVWWLTERDASHAWGDLGLEVCAAAEDCLRTELPHALDDPYGGRVLVEPVVPRPRLLIVGGGHIGRALAAQAVPLGYEVTVIDDRPEFTRPELFAAGVAAFCGEVAHELGQFPICDRTSIVIVTRGHQGDADALRACLDSPAQYIGMIGSRRKVALMRERLVSEGSATAEQLDRVAAPIGLDIGAVTVPEIATSIAAQLIAVRRGRELLRDAPDMRGP